MSLDRPVREQPPPWRWTAWLAWSLYLAATLLASSTAAFVIAWGDSTTCDDAPTRANVIHGQMHLALMAAVLLAAWGCATLCSPRRWPRMLLGFGISLLPVLLLAVTHTQPRDWTGGFCF